MRSFKRIAWCGLFLMLCVAVNGFLNVCMIPYTYIRVDAHNLRTARYEEVFVGSSHGKCGLDPAVMQEVTGKISINVCQGGEYPVDAYFLVKEAARNRKLSRVILEVDPGYWVTEPNQTADYAVFYQEMEFSPVKAEYFLEKMMQADFRTTLFPWYLYLKEIRQVPQILEQKRGNVYKNYGVEPFSSPVQDYRQDGMIVRKPVESDRTQEDQPVLFSKDELNPDAGKYFKKLAEFCEKEGIRLIAVTTPVPRVTYEKYQDAYDSAAVYFDSYMEKAGVPYYDFTRGWEYGMPSQLEEFADYEGHLYGDGAAEFTRSFGEILEEAGY